MSATRSQRIRNTGTFFSHGVLVDAAVTTAYQRARITRYCPLRVSRAVVTVLVVPVIMRDGAFLGLFAGTDTSHKVKEIRCTIFALSLASFLWRLFQR